MNIRRPTPRGVAVALAGLAVAAFTAVGLARATVDTGVDSFLPSSDPSLRQFEKVGAAFGGDPIVVLLESARPDQLLGAQLPALFGLEGRLSKLSGVAAVYGPASTLNAIAGQAQLLLTELVGRRDGLGEFARAQAIQNGSSPEQAARAADTSMTEFDRRYGPLIVDGLPTGLPTLKNPRFVRNLVYSGGDQPRPSWKYLVPDDRTVAILVRPAPALSQRGAENLVGQVRAAVGGAGLADTRVTVSGTPVLASAVGGEVYREIPLVSAVAIVVVGLCLLLVPWTRRRSSRLLPLAVSSAATAVTVAVLGWLDRPLSLGVLAFLPVLVGVGGYYPTYFSRRARPGIVVLVGSATAAGFAALGFSPLPFVRALGLTLALGVACAVALGWLCASRGLFGPDGAATAEPAGSSTGPVRSRRLRLLLGAGASVIALTGWIALPSLELQTSVEQLTAGISAIDDARHATAVLGSSSELDVTVEGGNVLDPAVWKWMREASERIVREHGDELRPVLSPTTLTGFLGSTPSGEEIKSAIRLLPPYLTSSVISSDYRLAVQSFGIRLDDLHTTRRLIDAVRAELPPAPAGYQVSITGLPTIAAKGDELVSGSRYVTNLAGIVMAGAVLLLGLRRRRGDVVRALAAAAFATGASLFLLWLTRTPLNPMTVSLGSLTAAVGCEFTIMSAESRGRADGRLNTAVLVAALTSGAGYVVLTLSQLAVMRQFGLLLAGSVALSYLAARLVVWLWPPPSAPVSGEAPEPSVSAGERAVATC